MVDHKDAESTQKATKTAFAMVIAFCNGAHWGNLTDSSYITKHLLPDPGR